MEKKWSTVGPILSRKFQITYKVIVCGEKTVKIGTTILSRKSSKDPSWLAMCNVHFRNELPTGLPARLMPFSIRVTSCRYDLAVIFTCGLCIDIAISNRHVISFREYSDNLSTIDKSTSTFTSRFLRPASRFYIPQYRCGYCVLGYLDGTMRVLCSYCNRYLQYSSHSGTVLYETHVSSQEEFGMCYGNLYYPSLFYCLTTTPILNH